ncbi:MAG: leucine-rich repeat protein [Bacteroidaceae bacterium]|nr:leucine-rich repeat protein [Bacteroidaceae bacterium]
MKLKIFITSLLVSLIMPFTAMAQTFTQDGIIYKVKDATTVDIVGTEPTATSLIIKKKPVYNSTEYTTNKISNGVVVSDVATTVTFDGPWDKETDISGTQFYNLKAVQEYKVSNPTGGVLSVEDGVLFSTFGGGTEIHLIAYPCKKTTYTTYKVPENVTNIQASAFRNNETLTAIDLNPQVGLIRNEAFAGCTNLTTINAVPNGSYPGVAASPYFETVDGVLFQFDTRRTGTSAAADTPANCKNFFPFGAEYLRTLVAYPAGKGTSYTIPAGTKVLGRSCFYGSKLTSINFANASDLVEIREYAFAFCQDLPSFTIPSSVQYINMKYQDIPINPVGSGVETGSGTYSYTGSEINAGEAMGSFDYCDNLILSIENGNNYFKVVNTENANILFSKDGKRLLRYHCTNDFPGCMVPRDVEFIDAYAFNDNYNLKHVVLPSKLTYISRNTFENATSLEYLTVPPLVANIYQDVFKGCTGISQVFMMPETPPTLKNANVFAVNNPTTIYVKPDKTYNGVAKTITTDYRNDANYPASRIENNIPVTLNASGLATMCRDFAVELPSNIKAYSIPNGTSTETPNDILTLSQTNLACTDNTSAAARFVPARTGEDYGDYNGVLIKADPVTTEATYQISVEDFANTYNLRGINQQDGAGAYSFSYTFPDEELVTSGSASASNIPATGGTISYNKIGGWNKDKTSAFFVTRDNGKVYQKFGGNESECSITIQRTSGSFAAGDKIFITGYNTVETGVICLKNASGNQIPLYYNPQKEITSCTLLTADDINADGSITLVRATGNAFTYIRSIQVYSSTKGNPLPRYLKESSYIIGTPVETNITVYDGDFTNFGLKGDNFQRTAKDGMVKNNKAYLHLPNSNVPSRVPGSNVVPSGAKFSLVFSDFAETDFDNMQATGIQELNAETRKAANEGVVYNLQGHRVGDAASLQQGNLPKGMYILNGKKYIVR